jgi:cytochrome c biogenesis protein CcmG, thiol:disulfide interchange protein DsbE
MNRIVLGAVTRMNRIVLGAVKQGMGRSTLALMLAMVATVLAACGEEPQSDLAAPPPAAAAKGAERIDDPELRGLREQANRLIDGGSEAFEAQLAELRGSPVVVNQWASWCPPCRAEFPIFQRLAEKYAGRVAFLGVDMQDEREAALDFMREFPTSYPHYFDEDASISRLFGGGRVSPTTGFYDARGKLTFSHLGAYADAAQLEAEIRSYALR